MTPFEQRVPTLRAPALVFCVLCSVLPTPGAWADGDSFFNGHGIEPTRGSLNAPPFEHIDPLTGNVVLNFTDLTLPGDGGFDLRIQRTYNSLLCEHVSLCMAVPFQTLTSNLQNWDARVPEGLLMSSRRASFVEVVAQRTDPIRTAACPTSVTK